MKIALCSDELYPVHQVVRQELERLGHSVIPFGALIDGKDAAWATTAESAAKAVSSGQCDEGVFCCWSGTGISIAANKVTGIRAALCTDPQTAKAAREWNDANVLCLSNRLLSQDLAKEILGAWFESSLSQQGAPGVLLLEQVERRWCSTGR